MTRPFRFLLALAVFALDRLTKTAVAQRFSAWDSLPVVPGFFNLIHTENRGAAFGILAEADAPWRAVLLVGVSLAVLALVGSWLWQPGRSGFPSGPWPTTGLSLVLGGALGNIYDRLVKGSVTDFLQFFFGAYEFPAFNVADSAITVGVGLLLLSLWRGPARDVPAGEVSTR